MFKQIVGRARAALSRVRHLLYAQAPRRGARMLAAVAVLLCTSVVAAPAMAQAVRLTSVSTNSYSAKGQVITFNFSVDSHDTPITGVTFDNGAPSPLVSGTCSTITFTGTCTATYTINDDDMAQGRVRVSPSFQMWRLGSDGSNSRWAGGDVFMASGPFWILAQATPSDPGNVVATAGVGSASVSFSPSNVPAGATVTYLVMHNDFNVAAQGSSSPIVVTGLTPGMSYRFNVQAISDGYSSLLVGPSNPVVPTAPNVSIAVSPASVGEDSGTPLVYTVTRNVALTTPTTVNLTFTGTATAGIDYNGNVASVTIPANASSATLSLVPVADTTAEADETAVVSVAAGTGYTVGSPSSATGTIVNANQPTLTINDVSLNEGNAGQTDFTFTVSLNQPAGAGGASFNYATSDGSATAGTDYAAASGTKTIPAGSSTATISVKVNGDTTYEPDETFFVNLSNVSGATVVDGQGVGTILNDDPVPAPTISSIAPNNGGVAGGTSVTLTGANFSGATAVKFGATAAATYTFNSATSIIATSPAGSAGTVDITVTTAGGTSVVSAADRFTYVNPPVAGNFAAAVAYGSSNNAVSPDITGGAATSVAVASGPRYGTAAVNSIGTGINYTPKAGYAGSDSFTYILSNVAGTSAPATVTVTVIAPTLALSPAPGTLPGAAMGMAYSQLFAGSGGAAPYFYQLTGNPPNGLTIDSTTGVLSGTPTAPGTFTFDVMATDSSTGSVAPFSKTQSYSLTVSPPPAVESITRSDRSPTNASILTFSVTFSEPVSGVDSTDFSLTSTGTASGLMRWIVGSGSVYSVAVDNVSGNGTLRLDLNASGTGIQGVALGNAIAGGFTAGQVYTVDTAAPVVASVSVPAAGRYPAGSTLDFLVTFNEVIVVTGNPQLALIVGGRTVYANYATGSGTQALRFTYTVASGDRDDDGIAVGVLGLNGGSLKDEADNAASHTLNSVGATSGVLVGLMTQAITAFTATPANPVFSVGGTFAVSATGGASGEAVLFASTAPAVCTVAGSTVTMVSAGSCELTANQAGNGNYNAAPQELLSVTIGAATQAITGFTATPANPVFSAGDTFAVSATGGASGEAVVFASTTPGVCTVVGSTVTMVSAGSCALTADQAGNSNYNPAPQETLSVTIGAATQAITGFTATPANPVFSAGGTFAVSANGGASGEAVLFGSTTPAVCTVAGSTVTMVAAGSCELTANQAGNGNYIVAPQEVLSVSIGLASQSITGFVANPSAPVFSAGGTFAVSATGGASGEAVLFASTTPAVCTVAGSTVTMVSAGSCELTANQAGNGNYNAAPQEPLSVTIGAATQAITAFAATPANPVFSAGDTFAVSATGGASGEAVVFASTTPGVCTVVGSTVTMVSAGSCALTADQAGNSNYNAAPQETLSVTIGAATQAITAFTATPANPVFSAGDTFAVSATGGASGEAVVFASTTPGVCTVVGSTVTMVSAGSCALTADQAGNSNYNAAPQETLSVTIGAATQAITGFTATPANPVFSAGDTFAVSATGGASGEAVVFASTTPGVCTVVGSTVTMVSAGSCALTADQAGNSNYNAAPQETLSVTIGAATQAITAFTATPANPVFSAGDTFAVSATGGASGEAVVFASTTPGVCTVVGSTVTMVSAGSCALTADQAGNSNYNAAPQETLSVTIGAATQAITAFTATPANPVFSAGDTFAVSATGGASGEAVVFASTTPGVCTVVGSTVTMVSAGSCALTADQAGNSNYIAAPQETLSVTIGAATQAITGFTATPANPVFSAGDTFAVSATGGASGEAVVFASTTPGVCTVVGSTVTMVSAGSCALTADQAGNSNYNAAPQETLSVTIGAATQAITGFTATPANPVFSAGDTFAVSATGGASGEAVLFGSTTPAVCTVAGSTVTMVAAGSCELTANQAGNSNYSAAPQETLSVTIGAATQAITGFTATPANPVFSAGGTFAVSATGGASGEAVLFGSTTPAVCTVAGSTVTMVAAGSCELTANQAGNSNYSAAPQETLSVTIGAATQAITGFTATPANPVFSAGGTFAVSATGGASGEAVVFASTTPGVCTVVGSTVTMVSAGSCALTADQAGNSNYIAAPQETLSVTIGAATQAITGFTATPANPVFSAGDTFAVSATGGASGEAVVFASTTPGVCTVVGSTVTMVSAGSCALTADQAGNSNYIAAPQETLSVTIGAATQAITGFTATPANPVFSAGGTFAVSATGGASGEAVLFGSTTPAVCTVAASTVTMVSAGSCDLTANQTGNGNYSAAPQETLSVTIGAATQAITGFVANPSAPVFSAGGTFALNANGGASGETVLFGSITPAVCTVTGSTVTMVSAGSCALTADQAGNASFSAAPQQALNVSIGLASQAITGFTANPSAPVFSAGGTFALSANGGVSGEAVLFASTTPAVCKVTGATVTMVAAGSCALTADQAGNASFSAAPQQALNVSIGLASQAITGFTANPSAPVFSAGGTFALSANGGASGEAVVFASTTPAVCTVAGATVTMVAAGSCALTADQAGSASYSAAPQQALNVSIGMASQAITGFTANPSAPVFSAGGTFALSANGGASGEAVVFASTTPAVCTVAGATVTMVAAGSCALTADQAGSASFSAAPQQALNVSIGLASQAITGFTANPSAPVFSAGGTFALSANGGASGEAVVFASTTPAVCTVAGSTVTMVAAGSCALSADQAGNASYSAAPKVNLQTVIGKASPVLSWLADLRKRRGEAAFDLPDPGSDGPGGFSFQSSDANVARVDGRTVTLVGAGTATLTATQAASADFIEASVSLQLTVDERPDPSHDPGVTAGVQAQVDASLRFVQAQQDNIRSRLSQLRHGGSASSHAMSVNLQGAAGQQGLSLNAGQLGAPPPKLPAGWGFWSAGAIQWGERDARGNAEGAKFRTDGVSVGMDRRFGEHAALGLAGGFGWNETDFNTVGSGMDSRQRSLAMYGNWHDRAWFVDGLVGWGQLDFDIRRRSNDVGASATASREGKQHYASLSLGYDHQGEVGMLTGYGRLDASRTTLQAYREHGLGDYDLQYRRQTLDSSTAALGVEGRYAFRTARASVRPSWMLEWRQALRSNGDAALNYVVAPSENDYLLGVRSYNDNTLAFGGGVEFGFSSGWTMALQFRREQARDVFANSFGLRLSYGQQAPLLDAEQVWWRESGLTRPQLEAVPRGGK